MNYLYTSWQSHGAKTDLIFTTGLHQFQLLILWQFIIGCNQGRSKLFKRTFRSSGAGISHKLRLLMPVHDMLYLGKDCFTVNFRSGRLGLLN